MKGLITTAFTQDQADGGILKKHCACMYSIIVSPHSWFLDPFVVLLELSRIMYFQLSNS
ncbi:hypothetical protein DESC_880146 [Desulfosarcina cetonica]|nr:hypothetical protein DESC_880146 [Desulfosarcina cetonica]